MFLGNVASSVGKRDIEKAFKSYGRIRDVHMKKVIFVVLSRSQFFYWKYFDLIFWKLIKMHAKIKIKLVTLSLDLDLFKGDFIQLC